MEKKELREQVMAEIRELLHEDIDLDTVDLIKLNDLHLTGVVFKQGDYGATLYIEDFADDSKTPAEIAEEMMTAYETSTEAPPIELIDSMKNMQKLKDVKDHLIVTLADIERNHDFLKTVPYKEIGNGFAFICRVFRADSDGMMAATITKDLAESNHWNLEEMFRLAIDNTMKINPPRLYEIGNALFGQTDDDLLANDTHIRNDTMLVLTNDAGMFGAAGLFMPGMVEKLLKMIGEGFFAIPSSQHEFILLPESSGCTLPALKAMCKEANATIVALKDILSDNILYISDREIISY